jgi:hypothetical protein
MTASQPNFVKPLVTYCKSRRGPYMDVSILGLSSIPPDYIR